MSMRTLQYPIFGAVLLALLEWPALADTNAVVENKYFRFELGSDAQTKAFIDKSTGRNWCAPGPAASVEMDEKVYPATSAAVQGNIITYAFGSTGVTASVKLESQEDSATFELVELTGPNVFRLHFLIVDFGLKGEVADPFAACGLGCNLITMTEEIPGHTKGIHAYVFPRLGWKGAKVMVAAAPTGQYRELLKKVVPISGMAYSKLGGPWALDAPQNRGSYLIDFGGEVGENNIDEWINLAHALGAKQIDFHTGKSMRFGDYVPNPKNYPNGKEGVKAVIDKMHQAGLLAGLHTYSQFVAKDSRFVTPVPDPRLAKLKHFTLSSDISVDASEIPVDESTADVSMITGFFLINSTTVQIGNELINFKGVSKEPPYKFTECERGAFGTKAEAHAKGADTSLLKQMFELFVPDSSTDFVEEVARQTAEVYNDCGFDMIYLDALDGSYSCSMIGTDHTPIATRFTWELNRNLKKPAIMEMSTFSSPLWGMRSRIGAWDSTIKAFKTNYDIHASANATQSGNLLPSHMGWWSIYVLNREMDGMQPESVYTDHVELMCTRALAYDSSLSYLLGFTIENYKRLEHTRRLCALIKQYEELRLGNYFSPSTREKLKQPGSEFTLQRRPGGGWRFSPAHYDKHVVSQNNAQTHTWAVENPYKKQPVKLRIEALSSMEGYDSSNAIVLAEPREWADPESTEGVSGKVEASDGCWDSTSGSTLHLAATNTTDNLKGSWFRVSKTFTPDVDIRHKGMGLMVEGDGSGASLWVELASPSHMAAGASLHLIKLDFTGWQYFELVELEGDAAASYTWPGNTRAYENWVSYEHIHTIRLYMRDLPVNTPVKCAVSTIKALPLSSSVTRNPFVTVNNERLMFPVEMKRGYFLEFNSIKDCKLYDGVGSFVGDIQPEGNVPDLQKGQNALSFGCTSENEGRALHRVVTISTGKPLPK